VRWENKDRLISYFLSNTSAKNIVVIGSCMSRLYQVKGGMFFETQCRSSRGELIIYAS